METGAHSESDNDDQLVLPCVICTAHTSLPGEFWCRAPVCLALGVLTPSAGKLGGVCSVRGGAME